MRKKYFFIAGIVLLCLAGWGFYQYQRPRANIANKTADFTMNAPDLFGAYQKDETASNKKFSDKIIEVKGKVAEIEQTDTTMSIQLKGGDMGGINCSLKTTSDEKIQPPAKGAIVTIKGICTGYLMDVNLVDCVLEK
jgi:hypothetical protein